MGLLRDPLISSTEVYGTDLPLEGLSGHELRSGYPYDLMLSLLGEHGNMLDGTHDQDSPSCLTYCGVSAATGRDLPVTLKVPFYLPLWLRQ